MMPTSEEASDAVPHIDDGVFENAELLADEWTSGVGKRLYKLADPIGDHAAIHARTTYEKSIDDDTGETVEEETLDGLGRLMPRMYLGTDEQLIRERLEGEDEDGHEYWDELRVESMCEMFKRYFEQRIPELLATDHHYMYDVIDLHLLKEVRISMDEEEEAQMLADRYPDYDGWETFLWAVREETTFIDRISHDEHPADRAYAFIPEFEPVAEWRLRAVENHLCGVYKNAPALANVAALLDSNEVSTQAAIADELGKDKSTISQQVSDVEEWQDRSEWMCANRVP